MTMMPGDIGQRWHIAMVRPNTEPRVVVELRERGFQAICPSYRKEERVGGSRREWRGRSRIEVRTVPAFPNYIMFAGSPWQRAREVRELTTVIRCPGDPDKAATLPAATAARLLGPSGDGIILDLCQTVQEMHDYLSRQGVRIISGLYAGKEGIVQSSTYARVRILVGSAELNLPKFMVKPLEEDLASASAI